MRFALILVIALIPFSKCWAMPMSLCHDSAVAVANELSASTAPDAKMIYEVAFGKREFSRAEIAAFQKQAWMSDAISLLALEDGNGRLAYLLSNGIDPDSTVPGGAPVIVAAVECENVPVVDALIKNGADIHASDSQNIDAMAEAVIVGSRDIYEMLTNAGYKVDCKTKQGQLVVRLARKQQRTDLIDDLLKHSESCEPDNPD